MFETNSIIRASAGTGKTFALATRFIRLMLLDGVKPETIVALTFSRAAAQEIYTKILERLCKAATDDEGAEKEWDNLLDDFRRRQIKGADEKLRVLLANPPPHDKDVFAGKLRELVNTQHLGAIATIDSFILKIVRNFPTEMGFQNAVTVLDPIDEKTEVDNAVRRALAKTDGSAHEVASAFVKAQKDECSRKCLGAIGGILSDQGWRDFVIAHPGCREWTAEGMCAQLGVPLESVCPDLSVIKTGGAYNPAEKFVQYARAYTGDKSLFPSDTVKKMMLALWHDDRRTDYGWTTNGGQVRRFEYGADGAAAIRRAITHMMNLHLKRQLEVVEAKIGLVKAVEKEYERMTRRAGKLTFADFTKFSAENEFTKRGIALKNVEFRFDSRFDHWALDEFQDTSELQWLCLKELVRNAAEAGHEDDGRTAMAVGDMKQSIYTWRGASAQPFEDIAAWEAFDGFERDFSESHRYGPNIADFVNRVFGLGNIKPDGIVPAACNDAVAAWRSGWRDHLSHEAPDHVKVVEAGSDEDDEEDEEILPTLCAELKSLWERHRAERSADTVGVLVRSNADGLKVVEYLRQHGLGDVVWEGMSPCGDDPVVQGVLALLKLADHPSDTAAWRSASELMDLRSLLLPDCATLEDASATVAQLLTRQGLARTLKDWCSSLRSCGRLAEDGLTSAKLCQLVEHGVAFEDRNAGAEDMLAFTEFVSDSSKREIAASSEVIRILTIHRSKGLGIDHVFVPLFEGHRDRSAIDMPKNSAPLFDNGEWVLSHLKKGSEQFNDHTRTAFEKMRSARFAESLRTYYVALTRAKKSMVVIVPAEQDESADFSKGLLMRDLVRSALGDLPYEVGTLPSLKPKKERDGQEYGKTDEEHEVWPALGQREVIERISPSRCGGMETHRAAIGIFDEDFGAAAQKGIDAHAEYAKIEWVDPDEPGRTRTSSEPPSALGRRILACGFREAFVKPSPEATVWRERSYELFDGKRWETGQFDRVVFAGEAGSRSATIYDFKTNALAPGESAASFAERMRAQYAPQMEAYRQALKRLTGIPTDRIRTELLLVSGGQAVTV